MHTLDMDPCDSDPCQLHGNITYTAHVNFTASKLFISQNVSSFVNVYVLIVLTASTCFTFLYFSLLCKILQAPPFSPIKTVKTMVYRCLRCKAIFGRNPWLSKKHPVKILIRLISLWKHAYSKKQNKTKKKKTKKKTTLYVYYSDKNGIDHTWKKG